MVHSERVLNVSQVHWSFSEEVAPALSADPGSTVVWKTRDCYDGQYDECASAPRWECAPPELDLRRLNPVTGPVAVEGARPGDCIAVRVLDIIPSSRGFVLVRPGVGVLGHEVDQSRLFITEVTKDFVHFGFGISLRTRPMIGTIGVSPAQGDVSSLDAGEHGGNMDHPDIGIGSTLYLPVYCEGAILSLGDVHACMGDSEASGSGVECSATVITRIDLIRGRPLRRPVVETESFWATTGDGREYGEALRQAASEMRALLCDRYGISTSQAYAVVTSSADARIGRGATVYSQNAGPIAPAVTVRMSLPKSLLTSDLGARKGLKKNE